jgi:hypothetical protein
MSPPRERKGQMLDTEISPPLFPTTRPTTQIHHLDRQEIKCIVIAVESVFAKLAKLQERVAPIYEEFGFRCPSAGVAARDVSERIELAIVQHCRHFTKGRGHADLARQDENWEVKVCQQSGLTINQSKVIAGENYIIINYNSHNTEVRRIWILWQAQDHDFSPRRSNSNARALAWQRAQLTGRAQLLYQADDQS